MDFEPKNSQISLLLMAIALILVGVVLFSGVAWLKVETTTVETNSDKTYQTDTKQIMGTYEANISVDWGPNVEDDYGISDSFIKANYGHIIDRGPNDEMTGEEVCRSYYSQDQACFGGGAYARLMLNLASALYLIVFAGIGFLFFGSTSKALENVSSTSLTRILAIFIALISVSMAVYFMFEYQSINDEIEAPCENIEGPCVGIEGFWGSDTWEGETSDDSQNFDTTLDAKWAPGLAWYLMIAVIPLLSLCSAYFITEDSEESEMVNYLPLLLFLFALVSLLHHEINNLSSELQFDTRFYMYGPVIVACILAISGLLISSWITYQLSDTGSPTLSIEYIVPETSSRLLALISIPLIPIIGSLKPLLLLPHMIILFFFNLIAMIMGWIGLICALFGSYPESVRNWILPCWKWNWRVAAYYTCLSDTYPPFSTLDDYPTDITFDEREGTSRSKLLTLYGTFLGGKFILLLPRRIVLLFYTIIAGIAVFLGPIVVLLLGKYPESWMDFIIKTRTQWTRINAYNMCLTEVFPPLYPGDTHSPIPVKTKSVNHYLDDLMSESIVKTEPEVRTTPSSVTIECPNCEAQMEIQKLGIIQNVTCEKCSTSGEIEI